MQTYSNRVCAVCGDTPAKIHYGVLACFGCKGFFRRAVKDGRNKYVCRFEKSCEVTKFERNACRYCRFRKCLLVGMNPDYVRPDREKSKKSKMLLSKKKSLSRAVSNKQPVDPGDWTSLLAPAQRKLLNDLSRLDNETQQPNSNLEGIADFSLKSLIADRSLMRKNTGRSRNDDDADCSDCDSNTLLHRSGGEQFMSIDRIVQIVDYVDQFLNLLEEDHSRKFSVEDKSALISNTMIHLLLFESVARYSAKGTNGIEDFKQSFQHLPINTSSISHKLFDVFELFKRKSPSIVEYSVIKGFIVSTAESTLLSNSLNESLTISRDSLSELLFKVIKRSRVRNSVFTASHMSNVLHFVYESRSLAASIRSLLEPSHNRASGSESPFHNIMVDIINPEVSDLLITTASCRKPSQSLASSTDSQMFHFSPPSLSPHQNAMQQQQQQQQQSSQNIQQNSYNHNLNSVLDYQMPSTSDSHSHNHNHNEQLKSSTFSMYSNPNQTPNNLFNSPQCSQGLYRPNSLSFPRLPLQMTKSIEDILKPPGMFDDPNIMNKPLSRDWADGVRLTPIFNKDIVSQFFPEFSQNQPF